MIKMRKRGFVWLLVGVGIYVGGLLAKQPFVLRGTNIPFGLILIGLGGVLLAWDTVHYRRERAKDPPPDASI